MTKMAEQLMREVKNIVSIRVEAGETLVVFPTYDEEISELDFLLWKFSYEKVQAPEGFSGYKYSFGETTLIVYLRY